MRRGVDGGLRALATECLRDCRPRALELPVRVGRYVVGPTLGRGSSGTVVRTFHPGLARGLALKLIERERGGAEGPTEAHALSLVCHPNVVRVYDAGEIDEPGPWRGRRYLVMECVEGEPMDRWLAARRGWREVLAVFVAAGRGLAAVHAAGLVHCDFKPANVMIAAGGAVKLVDLGFAVKLGGDGRGRVRGGDAAGTPSFVAPECWLGEPPSAASDQFSFCVALYLALYGCHPFCEAGRSAGWTRIVRPRVAAPGWIDDVLGRGLALAPEQRFAAMDALLGALDRDG